MLIHLSKYFETLKTTSAVFIYMYSEMNGKAKHDSAPSRKERPPKRGGGGRFEPYGNVNKRYSVFVSNIPYDVKWQALKDLMKEKGKASGQEIQLCQLWAIQKMQ